jgi:hypothetical protein
MPGATIQAPIHYTINGNGVTICMESENLNTFIESYGLDDKIGKDASCRFFTAPSTGIHGSLTRRIIQTYPS